MNPANPLSKLSALSLITLALVACGDGGSIADSAGNAGSVTNPVTPTAPANPTPAPTPALTVANAQGFWSATPNATTGVGAVILPNGQAWVIYQTGSTVTALAQGALSVSGTTFTGVGKHYTLPAGAVQDFSLSAIPGSATTTTATPTLINTSKVGAGTETTLTWTYNKTYETPATQASVQGRWSGVQGAVSLIWDIDSAGKLAGTSTTGCTYSGTLTPNASPVAVLDVAITESCAGTSKTLSGIATLNAAKTGLSVTYTIAAGAQGGVVVLQK
jgi:hypothetical protein